MPITENEKATLSDLFERCHAQWDVLNDWEKGFVGDQEKRWEEYGVEIRLSPKQWAALHKIEDILTNGRKDRR